MPGQHVGPTQPLTLTETRNGSFNPRDAGAACRTEREVPRHAAALDRFNPRDAGAACRTSPENHTNANPQVVSIPRCRGSMSDWKRFGMAIRNPAEVSIP